MHTPYWGLGLRVQACAINHIVGYVFIQNLAMKKFKESWKKNNHANANATLVETLRNRSVALLQSDTIQKATPYENELV